MTEVTQEPGVGRKVGPGPPLGRSDLLQLHLQPAAVAGSRDLPRSLSFLARSRK